MAVGNPYVRSFLRITASQRSVGIKSAKQTVGNLVQSVPKVSGRNADLRRRKDKTKRSARKGAGKPDRLIAELGDADAVPDRRPDFSVGAKVGISATGSRWRGGRSRPDTAGDGQGRAKTYADWRATFRKRRTRGLAEAVAVGAGGLRAGPRRASRRSGRCNREPRRRKRRWRAVDRPSGVLAHRGRGATEDFGDLGRCSRGSRRRSRLGNSSDAVTAWDEGFANAVDLAKDTFTTANLESWARKVA